MVRHRRDDCFVNHRCDNNWQHVFRALTTQGDCEGCKGKTEYRLTLETCYLNFQWYRHDVYEKLLARGGGLGFGMRFCFGMRLGFGMKGVTHNATVADPFCHCSRNPSVAVATLRN